MRRVLHGRGTLLHRLVPIGVRGECRRHRVHPVPVRQWVSRAVRAMQRSRPPTLIDISFRARLFPRHARCIEPRAVHKACPVRSQRAFVRARLSPACPTPMSSARWDGVRVRSLSERRKIENEQTRRRTERDAKRAKARVLRACSVARPLRRFGGVTSTKPRTPNVVTSNFSRGGRDECRFVKLTFISVGDEMMVVSGSSCALR